MLEHLGDMALIPTQSVPLDTALLVRPSFRPLEVEVQIRLSADQRSAELSIMFMGGEIVEHKPLCIRWMLG